jgi:negative regulator of sigma-B (phosphoserine phosphatase)
MDNSERGLIDWALATQTLAGQSESGDRQWVKVCASKALVAVVDGVGHGKEAAHAAQTAIATLQQFERESPIALFERCHEQLRSTRGAVMSLASFNAGDNTMTWLGVGNVEGVLLQRQSSFLPGQESLLQRPGVLGDHLPRLTASVIQVSAGDLLVFATDGIRGGFADHTNLNNSPQQIADCILNQYGSGTDDALVLVARYLNGKAGVTTR